MSSVIQPAGREKEMGQEGESWHCPATASEEGGPCPCR